MNERQDDLRSDRQTRERVLVRGTADNRAARRAKAARHRLAVRAAAKETARIGTVEIETEADGRFLAEYPKVPGAMAYGKTAQEAAHSARAIALRATEGRNWTIAEKRRYAVCVAMDQ